MRRGISELFFIRAYKCRVVVKTAHLRGFHDRSPFIYQRTCKKETLACNVIVNGVAGLVFEFSHHMIFAEKKSIGRNLVTLAVMSAAFVMASFLLIRRNRYDRI